MASGIYNRFKANLMDKNIDLANDTVKVMLVDSNHTFTATDNTKTDVDANEISGTGYTAGGKALTNQSVTQAASTKFDADNIEWTSATFSTSHAVLYNDTQAGDDLICSFDFGGQQSVSSGTFTIQWHSNGIITLS